TGSRKSAALFFFYGLFGAFRLSSVILTFPVVAGVLLILALREKTWKPLIVQTGMIALGTLVWLVPCAYAVGGLGAWFHVLRDATSFAGSFTQNLAIFVPYSIWMANVLLILALVHSRTMWRRLRQKDETIVILSLLIVVPALFFALFCYSKGYALLYIAPFALLSASLLRTTAWSKPWIAAALAANLLVVFAVPFVPPSDRSALSHAERSPMERLQDAAYRGLSFFSPTLAFLEQSDNAMAAVDSLLYSVPTGSVVLIDHAASVLAYPRALQAHFPALAFLTQPVS